MTISDHKHEADIAKLDTKPIKTMQSIRPDWNSTPLPFSTVRHSPNRVRGRILAVTSLTGIVLGLLLSVSFYLSSLVNLVQPLEPLGDPSLSLDALAALCAADAQAGGFVPAVGEGAAAADLMQAQAQFEAAQAVEPRADRQVRNILLISKPLDGRSEKINNEALLLLSINKRTETLRLMSFDRTLPSYIPGKGWSLLGHAACMGGADLVRQTLADNYRLKIDDAFVFDIAELAMVVDRLDGILVRVTADEVRYLRKNQPQLYVYEGLNRMNGELAVAYSQIAGVGGSNEPDRRLLAVLEAVHARGANQSVLEVKRLAQDVLPGLQTSLEPTERLQALMDLFVARKYPMETWAFTDEDPQDGNLRTIVSTQKRNSGAAYRIKALHAFLFES